MREYRKEDSIKFAQDNLAECAAEILEWKKTAILRDGKLRELAKTVRVWAGGTCDLQIAESIVNDEALKSVSA